MPKLLVIMLDGISADSFARRRGYMPHLSALARRGLVVENLEAEVCGTSFPGRTSIATGALASDSGIYGNVIWDGEQFRHATPDDVRVPTLPALAQAAGKQSAVVGYGMIRPEDTDLFKAPWWAGAFIQRSRDTVPVPTAQSWRRAAEHIEARLEAAAHQTGIELPLLPDLGDKYAKSALGDAQIMGLAGAVLLAEQPDLMFTEVLLPDTAQHYAGYDTPEALWSLGYSDALVGQLLARLEGAGLLEQYTIAVLSDHGHSRIDQALHPEVIIPQTTFACEGSMLHVVPKNAAELTEIRARLAEYGVEEYSNAHVPAEQREQVYCFVAPDLYDFEYDPARPASEAVGEPILRSSHGIRPGLPGDHRFMVLAGAEVSPRVVGRAAANQVAPTLASALGISNKGFAGESLLEAVLG
ncbi:MAG: alkaline phosphatase family protein [Meiothermus sp.]|nr:alkaline phosphatase family protein [Meiothermus sp.]